MGAGPAPKWLLVMPGSLFQRLAPAWPRGSTSSSPKAQWRGGHRWRFAGRWRTVTAGRLVRLPAAAGAGAVCAWVGQRGARTAIKAAARAQGTGQGGREANGMSRVEPKKNQAANRAVTAVRGAWLPQPTRARTRLPCNDEDKSMPASPIKRQQLSKSGVMSAALPPARGTARV